jgi:hypothetical protein
VYVFPCEQCCWGLWQALVASMCQNKHEIKYFSQCTEVLANYVYTVQCNTVEFISSRIHWTGAGLSKQFLCKPKFLLVNFCHCFCIWSTQLIRGALPLDIFFSYWFRSIRVPFYVMWFLLSAALFTHVEIFESHCNSLMVSGNMIESWNQYAYWMLLKMNLL